MIADTSNEQITLSGSWSTRYVGGVDVSDAAEADPKLVDFRLLLSL